MKYTYTIVGTPDKLTVSSLIKPGDVVEFKFRQDRIVCIVAASPKNGCDDCVFKGWDCPSKDISGTGVLACTRYGGLLDIIFKPVDSILEDL